MKDAPSGNGGAARAGVPLIDGIEKVTGRARYTADLDTPMRWSAGSSAAR